jgi:hypothetical protein
MRSLILVFFVGIAVVHTCAQSPPPVDPKIVLQVSIATNQREFHIGEVIPLELAFSSNVKDRYQVNMAQYDRSGRMNYERFDVSPADGAVDPLPTYTGGMGGLTNFKYLGSEPWTLFVLALASPEISQSDDFEKRAARKPAAVEEELLKRVHRDAIKRLSLLPNRCKEIADPAARERVQARIADALWQRDEARARKLFAQAYDNALTIPNPADGEVSDNLSCGQVRSEILRSVSEHDPILAAQLVARDKVDTGCSFGPRERNTYEDGRSVMLVQVASSILTKDPIGAARLARESLTGGIVSQFPEICRSLKEVNSGLGNELIDAAIEHIQLGNINALELVSMGREILGDPDMKGGKATLNKDKKVDAALATRLLRASLIAIARFVDRSDANQLAVGVESGVFSPAASIEEIAASFYAALTELLPAFDRYDSQEAAAARIVLERLTTRMDPVERNHMYVFYDNGDTPESLMAEAESNKDEKTKNELYELAAELADGKKSVEHVLEIVQRITDAERRADLHDSLLRNRIFKLLDDKRVDEARQLIDHIIRPELRVGVFIIMAQRSAGSGNAAETLPLLDEATNLLLTIRDGQLRAQAKLLMDIARIVGAIDSSRGFKTLKAAIDLVNTSAAMPVDPKAQSRYTGELHPTDSISLFCTDVRVFEVLSRADYFQTLKLTEAFNDKALSLAAELAVIRAGLSK